MSAATIKKLVVKRNLVVSSDLCRQLTTSRRDPSFEINQRNPRCSRREKRILSPKIDLVNNAKLIHNGGYNSVKAGIMEDVEERNTELEDSIALLCPAIVSHFGSNRKELRSCAEHYFDGKGKYVRPQIVLSMSLAVNMHMNNGKVSLTKAQQELAMTAEMIHTASLVHDDLIDCSDLRRGRDSVHKLWGQSKGVMAGSYILAVTIGIISRMRNPEVLINTAKLITDLVEGEFLQLGSSEDENERFRKYLLKTYKKTASLIANNCKSAAILAGGDDKVCEIAFQYGRNVGIAFQLIDDVLDFIASSDQLGKPSGADLKLGLATAPVLFAYQKYPQLHEMIMRKFSEPRDVENAFNYVHQSDGIQQTRFLAEQYVNEAQKHLMELQSSEHRQRLLDISEKVLHRVS